LPFCISVRHSASSSKSASAFFASIDQTSPPNSFHHRNCSKNKTLWAVTIDFGQRAETIDPRAHTTAGPSDAVLQAQFRIFTRPLDRQVSQFHAAGEEN
jgi:hypothetical protein